MLSTMSAAVRPRSLEIAMPRLVVQWKGQPNRIVLHDGRAVDVAPNDELVAEIRPGGVRFLDLIVA